MEQKTEDKKEPARIGDMDPETFFNVMLQVLDRKREGGDEKLMDMSVKEFTTLILDQYKTRAYQTAKAETDVAERVLTDWQGLHSVGAVTQPFRVKTKDDVVKLAHDLTSLLVPTWKGEIVVAIGLVNPEGGYSPPRPL